MENQDFMKIPKQGEIPNQGEMPNWGEMSKQVSTMFLTASYNVQKKFKPTQKSWAPAQPIFKWANLKTNDYGPTLISLLGQARSELEYMLAYVESFFLLLWGIRGNRHYNKI